MLRDGLTGAGSSGHPPTPTSLRWKSRAVETRNWKNQLQKSKEASQREMSSGEPEGFAEGLAHTVFKYSLKQWLLVSSLPHMHSWGQSFCFLEYSQRSCWWGVWCYYTQLLIWEPDAEEVRKFGQNSTAAKYSSWNPPRDRIPKFMCSNILQHWWQGTLFYFSTDWQAITLFTLLTVSCFLSLEYLESDHRESLWNMHVLRILPV